MREKDNVDVVIGNKIRRQRLLSGISQSELGRRVDVSFQQIQKYETGANRITVSMISKIGVALGVTLESLIAEVAQEKIAHKRIEKTSLSIDSARLLNAYQQISQPLLRRQLLELAYAMAKTR